MNTVWKLHEIYKGAKLNVKLMRLYEFPEILSLMIASILYWQIADSKFGNPFEIQSSSNNGSVYGRNPDQLGR